MMREAEANKQAAVDDATARSEKSRRVKKVSRSQARRFARERALQALYQWDVSAGQSSDVRTQFMDEQDMSRVDVDYFVLLFNGVSHQSQDVDEAMKSSLDRDIAELDPIERAVLRIATYELTQCPDIPARVVINEGIEITKRFGADKGHTYINGVLDKLANEVRSLEMKRR
jgi:N utilization substance protein B